jgi:formylglycine-generating enzyme required for sulfatase activity
VRDTTIDGMMVFMHKQTRNALGILLGLMSLGISWVAVATEPVPAVAASGVAQTQDFPSLEAAAEEIRHLRERINDIKSGYEKESSVRSKQVVERYVAVLVALDEEQPGEAEVLADFDARRALKKQELISQRDLELATLTPSALAAQEIAPLRERKAALEEHEYAVGPDRIEVELREYDAEAHFYAMRARSRTPALHFVLKGKIPMSVEEAGVFKRQWQSGAIHVEGKMKLVDDAPALTLVNGTTGVRMSGAGGVFMTDALRQETRERAYRPEMAVIFAGRFKLGSADYPPVHLVTFKYSFEIGKSEITQGQWRAVMGSDPQRINQCGSECPVENVSWEDAQRFILKLNEITGKKYRLPSEAEWEYACTAGKKQTFCGGEAVDDLAWYGGNSQGAIHPVMGKQANTFGLHDMSGNVWEWVEDDYQENFEGAPADGRAWKTDGVLNVVRGGSSSSTRLGVRGIIRDAFEPTYRFISLGFRIARTLP